MTNRKAPLYSLEVAAKSGGFYSIPQVDIRNCILDPHLSQNPCLQIINEEHAVLSLVWEQVVSISRYIPKTASDLVTQMKAGPPGMMPVFDPPVVVWKADGYR